MPTSTLYWVLSGFIVLQAVAAMAQTTRPAPLTPAALSSVHLTDAFWAPKLETNRTVTLWHNIKMCEETGRIRNFDRAAGKIGGDFEGIYFNDSDVYKVIEGASDSLAAHPDKALDAKMDDWIARIAAAQQPDGYLYTFYTVKKQLDQRFSNLKDMHELYCAGHLIEAAVAHHRATGKRTFLDVAIKLANLIHSTFGPDKRHGVPGHEEIELALFKLADETGDSRYEKLAEFFVAERGHDDGRKLYGIYHQDHAPVTQASEVVGHAVRQMYLLCAATDLARRTDDAAYTAAVDRLWDDLVHRKMYVTGGVGAKHEGEAFGEAFDLPNASAYAETCAGIGSALFSERLNRLHADARFFDAVERTLYNGFLSGVSLSGDKFFYVNPLASDGNHHRQSWYDCACCPPNVVRFMANLPTLMYATSYTPQQELDRIYVNLFAAGTVELKLHDGTSVQLVQETRYPWDGRVTITVSCDVSPSFELLVRLPGWANGATVKVNGQDAGERIERGYAVLAGTWHSGDRVDLNLPMPIERLRADPRVKANVGRVALQRGPIVYCFEAADNNGSTHDLRLPASAKLSAVDRPDLLGGVTVIQSDTGATAIPYYAWDNRAPGEMDVWVMEE